MTEGDEFILQIVVSWPGKTAHWYDLLFRASGRGPAGPRLARLVKAGMIGKSPTSPAYYPKAEGLRHIQEVGGHIPKPGEEVPCDES